MMHFHCYYISVLNVYCRDLHGLGVTVMFIIHCFFSSCWHGSCDLHYHCILVLSAILRRMPCIHYCSLLLGVVCATLR